MQWSRSAVRGLRGFRRGVWPWALLPVIQCCTCTMQVAWAGPGSQGLSHPSARAGSREHWGSPSSGYLPGDRPRPGRDVGLWVGPAQWGQWLGRAVGSWRPALLGKGLMTPGADVGPWAMGRAPGGRGPGTQVS